jgi:hypothetical protein
MVSFVDLLSGNDVGMMSFDDAVVSTAATLAVIESLASGARVAPRLIRADT